MVPEGTTIAPRLRYGAAKHREPARHWHHHKRFRV